MRPDPGRDVLERIQAELGSSERVRLAARLRELGFRQVWAQVDRAEPMAPVEEGMFILERLYPEMKDAHRASIRRQLAAAYRRGEWYGFERPDATSTPSD